MPAVSDYLLKTSGGTIQANLFVRLLNNVTGVSYISDAVTDANGKFTFNTSPPPPGGYTVFTGPTGTIAGTPNPTGDTNYLVPVTTGDDIVAHSITTLPVGPYNVPVDLVAGGAAFGGGNPWFDPIAFGAVGDGVTDSSTPFLNMEAKAAVRGGTMRVSQGKSGAAYVIGPLTLHSNERLELDQGVVIKLKNGSNDYLIKAPTGGTSGPFNQVAIEGHGILDANGANQTAAGGMNLAPGDLTNGSIDGLVLRDFTLKNAYSHGIRVTEGPGGSAGAKLAENVTVDGHGVGAIGYGFYFDYSPGAELIDLLVRNSHAYDAYIIGHGGRYKMLGCVAVDSDIQFPFADDSVIMECVVIASVGNGINNDNNTSNRMRIVGCVIISCSPGASYGALRVTGTDAIIADNHVTVTALNTSTKGIMVIGAGARIHDNRVVGLTGAGSLGYGIAAEGSSNADIHDNYLSGPFLQGVSIEHDDVTVHDNKIDGPLTGIILQNSAAIGRVVHRVNVHDNTFLNNATAVIDWQNQNDPSNRIHHNLGYNPQGVAAISVTASPFTYTNADNVFESVSIDGGTVTTVVKNGITLHSFAGSAARCAVQLENGEAVTVTYTVAPTMNKDRK